MRYEQSLDPEERALAALPRQPARRPAGPHGATRPHPVPGPVLWGMYDAFLTPDYPLMLARMVPTGTSM